MALSQPHTHSTTVLANIEHVLTSEANRIGSDIHKQTLHQSPWIDLIKKSTFPSGMGYQISTLVYDRALPVGKRVGDTHLGSSEQTPGVNWTTLVENTHATDGSAIGHVGGSALDTRLEDNARIDFTRVLKNYALSKAVIESPRINIEDLRFAAHRTDQLRAIMDLLKESTRWSWEERYRDEYAKLCDNIILCKTTGTAAATNKEGSTTPVSAGDVDSDDNNSVDVINANISNKILDDTYFKLVRAGAGADAYGRENGRPVFALVCSSEASYQLQTEAGFRDDVRYNNAKVSELIAPLGVEKSFRGFYHLCDDLAPRYSATVDGSDLLVRVYPYKHDASNDIVTVNTAYDTADYEEAFVLVDNVMESLVPEPISGGSGVAFDPVSYKGEFKWTNIPDVSLNPDGTIGFFRGIMASASKPIKTNFGYSILFKRTSTTPAA